MSPEKDPVESTRMSLGEHIEELRKRLFKSVLVLIAAFGVAWWYKEDLAQFVMKPWTSAVEQINTELSERYEKDLVASPNTPRTKYFLTDDPADKRLRDPVDAKLSAFNIGDSFFFALNISMYFAAFFAGPFVLWQMWQFVAAGLYRHEKRMVSLYFPFSVLLFLFGVVFCYLWVVPIGMYYLAVTLPLDQVRPQIGLSAYFDFLSTMCLSMGAVFQLPLLMIFLSSIGLVDPKTYAKYRGHFLVIALFVAGVITPGPDWYSQVLMTAPMYVLYEIGILVARWRARPRSHPKGS